MAKITLSKVQVSRVFQDGRAAEVIEKYNTANGPKETKYTLWFDEAHGLAEGTVLDVDGLLGARIREFEGRDGKMVQIIQLNVNKPRVGNLESPVMSNKVNEAAILEVWETATPGKAEPADQGAPF